MSIRSAMKMVLPVTIALCASPSIGQEEYRVYDLGPLGDFIPNPVEFTSNTTEIDESTGTFGINCRGECAYAALEEMGTELHAYIFLPFSNYGLSNGSHDLTALSNSPAPAVGQDINKNGIVVGQSDGTTVSDEGLARLAGLESLESLYLINTKVTDAGLEQLARLKSLQELHLQNTTVTNQGLKRLKEALPHCNIQK